MAEWARAVLFSASAGKNSFRAQQYRFIATLFCTFICCVRAGGHSRMKPRKPSGWTSLKSECTIRLPLRTPTALRHTIQQASLSESASHRVPAAARVVPGLRRYCPALAEEVRFMVWDTAGQEEFDAVTRAYYRGGFPTPPQRKPVLAPPQMASIQAYSQPPAVCSS